MKSYDRNGRRGALMYTLCRYPRTVNGLMRVSCWRCSDVAVCGTPFVVRQIACDGAVTHRASAIADPSADTRRQAHTTHANTHTHAHPHHDGFAKCNCALRDQRVERAPYTHSQRAEMDRWVNKSAWRFVARRPGRRVVRAR